MYVCLSQLMLAKPKPPANIMAWLRLFATYTSVYLQRLPTEAPSIMSNIMDIGHGCVIQRLLVSRCITLRKLHHSLLSLYDCRALSSDNGILRDVWRVHRHRACCGAGQPRSEVSRRNRCATAAQPSSALPPRVCGQSLHIDTPGRTPVASRYLPVRNNDARNSAQLPKDGDVQRRWRVRDMQGSCTSAPLRLRNSKLFKAVSQKNSRLF